MTHKDEISDSDNQTTFRIILAISIFNSWNCLIHIHSLVENLTSRPAFVRSGIHIFHPNQRD